MKKKTYKIIICISLVIMLFVSFGNVFGATNPNYKPTVSVSENALDSKIKSSVLLDTLANMINAVASLAESLLGGVFKTLTKENIFPWADRIIFNGIGFLDINFLNPDSNSLFGSSSTPTILGDVVRQVYSTVFSLAILFLGVAVGIMAIRLAISTIAAEKAKYKQAIVNWATCIVMLFLMHYILAFVFWVNEQMVQIASGILKDTIAKSGLYEVDFSQALNSVIEPEQRVQNFIDAAKSLGTADAVQTLGDPLVKNEKAAEVANRLLMNSNYCDKRLVYLEDNSSGNAWTGLMQLIGSTNNMMATLAIPRLENDVADSLTIMNTYNTDDKIKQASKQGYYKGADGHYLYTDKKTYLESNDFKADANNLAYVISRKESASKIYDFYRGASQDPYKGLYPDGVGTYGSGIAYKINSGDNPNLYQSGFNAVWSFTQGLNFNWKSQQEDIQKEIYKAILSNDKYKDSLADKRLEIDGYIISAATGVKASTTDIIANLGQFFKQSAYVYTTEEVEDESGGKKEVVTGWRASKVSVTGALLYAIFLFQSCMYFITYVKRLFFVIMLSMFGPLVVIYDFFMKSAG